MKLGGGGGGGGLECHAVTLVKSVGYVVFK